METIKQPRSFNEQKVDFAPSSIQCHVIFYPKLFDIQRVQ